MTTRIEPAASAPPRRTGWDALLAAVLGVALLLAGWLDLAAYLRHRGHPDPPGFAFLVPPGGARIGEDEQYLLDETLVWLDHMGSLEPGARGWFRHGFGPRSAILLWTHRPHAVLNLKYYNDIDGQDFTVLCNGQVIERLAPLPAGTIERQYVFALRPGSNEIAFAVARYNRAGVELNPADARPMAGAFVRFDLTLD